MIACFGLAYKAGIGDLRESPALEVVRRLGDLGCGPILAVEPHIETLPDTLSDTSANIALVDAETAVAEADLAILPVDHPAFAEISQAFRPGTLQLDTRGLWHGTKAGVPTEADPKIAPLRTKTTNWPRQPAFQSYARDIDVLA